MIFKIIEECSNCDFEYVPPTVRLTGVTMGNRQIVISKMKKDDKLILVRDYNNEFDKNAIAVLKEDGTSVGWIPRDIARIIAPEIDCGVKWQCNIDEILGNEETLRGVSINLFYFS